MIFGWKSVFLIALLSVGLILSILFAGVVVTQDITAMKTPAVSNVDQRNSTIYYITVTNEQAVETIVRSLSSPDRGQK